MVELRSHNSTVLLVLVSLLLLSFPFGLIHVAQSYSDPALTTAFAAEARGSNPDSKRETHPEDERLKVLRERMVSEQIARRGVKDALVLKAMRKVPRHLFVPEYLREEAYNDYPLPIGHSQTISQPFIVASMTEFLKLKGGQKVLEIGTGSGYQAAILREITGKVLTIEIIEGLAKKAEETLRALGYSDIRVICGDGYVGLPDEAPFDAIIVTAAPDHIPQPLIDQLKPGGRMVIPVGDYFQELMLVTKTKKGVVKKAMYPVRFVPMTGEAQKKKK